MLYVLNIIYNKESAESKQVFISLHPIIEPILTNPDNPADQTSTYHVWLAAQRAQLHKLLELPLPLHLHLRVLRQRPVDQLLADLARAHAQDPREPHVELGEYQRVAGELDEAPDRPWLARPLLGRVGQKGVADASACLILARDGRLKLKRKKNNSIGMFFKLLLSLQTLL